MRILFVDDEPRILQGIERMLFYLAGEWDITCVQSGSEALKELEAHPCDVIVSDMRMPGMDGAALLHEVQERFPGTVRIVLSGQAEVGTALRAVPVAHQYLSKPCEAHVLQEVVERACNLQSLLSDETLRGIVGHIDNLPSVPRIYSELTEAIADPQCSAKDVARVLSQDSAMCAKVLQLVSSSFFARPTGIATVRHAVVFLGFQVIRSLAMSIEVFRAFTPRERFREFSIQALHEHVLHCAAIAKNLLTDKEASSDAFLASMLHDIGKLVMAVGLQEQLVEALELAKAGRVPLHMAEEQLMGVTHAEIGAYLLGIWGLPYPIVEAVANHHDPTRICQGSSLDLVGAVYVANSLSHEADPDHEYLSRLGVEDHLASWRVMATELKHDCGHIGQ